MKVTAEHARWDAYFNVDSGSGKIRSVNMQGNDTLRPIFTEWLRPFADLGAATVSYRATGASDHVPFDAVGLNGISFIQDPLEYGTRTHHSNMDVFDRVQGGNLAQMAAIVASFVYNAANREEMLPRIPLPKPQPARQPGAAPARASEGGLNMFRRVGRFLSATFCLTVLTQWPAAHAQDSVDLTVVQVGLDSDR